MASRCACRATLSWERRWVFCVDRSWLEGLLVVLGVSWVEEETRSAMEASRREEGNVGDVSAEWKSEVDEEGRGRVEVNCAVKV